MTKQKIIFILLFICTGYMACTKSGNESGRNPCLEPKDYYLTLGTYRPADTGATGIDSNLPSAIIGFVDTNVIFYDGKWRGSKFIGPLSGIADSARWYIQTDTLRPSQKDTLTFYYERKPVFLSTACGYTFTYSLQRLVTTNYYIDSARIEQYEINGAPNIIHVKVFY